MSEISRLEPPIARHPGFNRAMHPDRLWIRLPRLAVGVLVLVALVQKTYDATLPDSEVDLGQLTSEFTVQSNLVFGFVLIASASLLRGRLPHWWDHLFGALVFYLVMTGLIYALLVAPPGEPWWTWDIYWPQMVHHRLAPLFAVLDWLLVTRTVRGRWWRPLAWLVYPVVFLAWTWLRGAIDGWYVYDFLDPTLEGGWPTVLAMTAQVLLAFLVVALLVHVAGVGRAALAAPRERHVRMERVRA